MDKYEKIEIVGRGAHGTVHLCRRRADGKNVIIKEIAIDDVDREERQAALNEVRVLAMLKHPNIIDYFDSFLADKALMIAMEYAEGGTIFEYLQRHDGYLSEEEIMRLFVQMLVSVQYVHSLNILHRDLKTQNIMLDRTQVLVKVCDFGISKVLSTKTKEASTVVGTPCYISPELCEGKTYNQKSDVWALGCILYELASRNRAFEAPTLPALVMKIMRGTFAPISSHYSDELHKLILKLLHTDPKQRPRTHEVLAQPICMKAFLGLQCSLGLMPLAMGPKLLSSRSRGSEKGMGVGGDGASAAGSTGATRASGTGKTATVTSAARAGRGKGDVLMWGGGYTQPTSMKFVSGDGSNATRVALGRAQRLALTSTGKVLTFQSSKAGSEYLVPGARKSQQPSDTGLDAARGPAATASWQNIEGLEPVTITRVACGDMFAAILTNRGILMTFGSGVHGTLGHGSYDDIIKPRIVDALMTQSVEMVSCGTSHMAASTAGGEVFTWGDGSHGCLGTGHYDTSTRPCLAKQLSGGRPRVLHCGVDCTLLVDASGQLYACGSNRCNKLALGAGTGAQAVHNRLLEGTAEFTPVPRAYFNDHRLTSVSSGSSHSAMITETGACFTVGSNASGQLGYEQPADDDSGSRPQLVAALLAHRIQHVSCGDQFTVAATKDQIFAWGKGRRGRLASAMDTDQCSPVEVNLARKCQILSLQASHGTTMVAVTRE